jgi:alkane 1-monooxygenase
MPRPSAAALQDLRFAAGLLLPALALFNVTQRPDHAGIGALVIWLFIAASEATLPPLQRSPAPAGTGRGLLWLLRAYVLLQMALLAAGLRAVADADWTTVAGVAFAVGFVTGAQGITYAHELGHSRHRADRFLAWLLMASVGYPQFMVEHYRGHHLLAATWDDPASARRGESLWRFLPRTLGGHVRNAWTLEAQRAGRRRGGWLASPLAWCWLATPCFVAALWLAGSPRMAVFWLAQAAFAVWLLETVNYIEHYGLQRRAGAQGRIEPFGVAHAWNADHLISNSLLANLQRHSDHHMHAGKPYPELQALAGPQLPTGYAGCLLLAAVPPLWFALMHPRLDALAPA